MSPVNTCPRCGGTRSANAPSGLCPTCLLRLGMDTDEIDTPSSVVHIAHRMLKVSGMAQDSGLLDDLDATVGHVPRVLLRDSKFEETRPVRLGSEQMPDLTADPGRYQLLGEIARGGMGVIFKGRDIDLGRDLAVKVILEKHRDRPEMICRFVEEAQIGGQLQHPGIVPVYEIGRFPDGRIFIAMKLVRGRTLAALLEDRNDPSDDRPRFLAIFEQVCQTMAYTHTRGVVHRDLKPSNVMVGDFGEVQVMDWGLAKVLDQGGIADEERAIRRRADSSAICTVRTGSDADESRAGSVLGTPAYMPPEQAAGVIDTLDERADVFGLGSILSEILTGHPAYTGRTSAEIYRRAERADLSEAHARLDSCSADADLVTLAKSCLSPVAKDRPRDAGVVLTRVTAYLASVDQRLRAAELANAHAEARIAGERKRRLLTMALASSVFATTLVALGGWIWVARDRANRVAETADEVTRVLEEASMLRGQALAKPGDPARWAEAIAAAKRASVLLVRDEGRSELQGRVDSLLAAIARDRDSAEAAGRDHWMLDRLAAIHDDFAVHLDSKRMDAEYSAAFRDYKIDVDHLDPAEAGRLIAERPIAVELAAAIDHWLFNRRRGRSSRSPEVRRLVEAARAADHDPWRSQMRDAMELMETNKPEALAALKQLATTADLNSHPGATVARLARALSQLGDRTTAIATFRLVQRAHPNDFWINADLGQELMHAQQFDEAARFFSVAVAVRPRSSIALRSLSEALRKAGHTDEAAAFARLAGPMPDRSRPALPNRPRRPPPDSNQPGP